MRTKKVDVKARNRRNTLCISRLSNADSGIFGRKDALWVYWYSFLYKTSALWQTVMTILARLAGVDTSGGNPWYQLGMEWAMRTGVSDGTGPEADITREQFVAILWRYAGEPAANGTLTSYADSSNVSNWARTPTYLGRSERHNRRLQRRRSQILR